MIPAPADASSLSYLVVDGQGFIRAVTDTAAELLNVQPRSLVGRPYADVLDVTSPRAELIAVAAGELHLETTSWCVVEVRLATASRCERPMREFGRALERAVAAARRRGEQLGVVALRLEPRDARPTPLALAIAANELIEQSIQAEVRVEDLVEHDREGRWWLALPGNLRQGDLEALLARIGLAVAAVPFVSELGLAATIGAAAFPEHADSGDKLLRAAAQALGLASEIRPGSVVIQPAATDVALQSQARVHRRLGL